MKIKKEFYEKIKAEIANNFTNINFIKEYKDELSKNPKIKDVSKRLRWDLFYSIKPEIRIPLVDEIYQSCNDNHLDDECNSRYRHSDLNDFIDEFILEICKKEKIKNLFNAYYASNEESDGE